MKKRTHTILFLGVLSFILQITRGDYDVLVRFLEYNRNQDACDLLFVSGVECDVYFRVCLQPFSPGQGEICRRKNSNILLENTHYFLFSPAQKEDYTFRWGNIRGEVSSHLENTHYFLFSPAQKEDYTFRWGNIRGEPIFNILIKVFDLDPVGEDDFLGTTSYNHVGSGPIVRNVTTTPADMNLRVKFMLEIKCSSRPCESTSTGLTSTKSKSIFTTRASIPSQSTSTQLIPSRSKSISITRASTRGKSTSPGLISTRSKIVYTTRASTPGKSTSTARTFPGLSSASDKYHFGGRDGCVYFTGRTMY